MSMRLSFGATVLSCLLAVGCLGTHSARTSRSEPPPPRSSMQGMHAGYGRLDITLKASGGGETFPDSTASTGPRVVANASLVFRRIGGGRVWRVTTDANGHFAIALPHGRYAIRFAASRNAATWVALVREGGITTRTFIEFVHTL